MPSNLTTTETATDAPTRLDTATDTGEPLLSVRDLKTHFATDDGVVRAVDGVSFDIYPGQILGVVGETGCGKSATARSILRIVQPPGRIVGGEILLDRDGKRIDLAKLPANGRQMRSIRGGDIGLVFQEPMASFSPVHTIGNQIIEAVRLDLEVDRAAARGRALELLKMVGIPRPDGVLSAYAWQLSGGLQQRAMIAMALAGQPRLLIADEPTTALDVTTQSQILKLIRDLQQSTGLAIMLITHDLGVIAEMADQVVVMYLGKVVEQGPVDTIFHAPKHPYTQALLSSIPTLDAPPRAKLTTVRGDVPHPSERPPGCPFHPRCVHVMTDLCELDEPSLRRLEGGHRISCHLPDGAPKPPAPTVVAVSTIAPPAAAGPTITVPAVAVQDTVVSDTVVPAEVAASAAAAPSVTVPAVAVPDTIESDTVVPAEVALPAVAASSVTVAAVAVPDTVESDTVVPAEVAVPAVAASSVAAPDAVAPDTVVPAIVVPATVVPATAVPATNGSSQQALVQVRGLRKFFPIQGGQLGRIHGHIRAVDDVNFDVYDGETLALVGESGSGKTTTALCILRALDPDSGSIRFRIPSGEVDLATVPRRQLRRLRPQMQMVFQDPYSSLNPRMTILDIVSEPLLVNGVTSKRERVERVTELLSLVGMSKQYLRRFPHALSGGQRQRIGIARALALHPRLVVADEPVSALDVSVRAQTLNLLLNLQQKFGLSYLFVSHDLSVVKHISDRVAVMYVGQLVELGSRDEIFARPLHPYTASLLAAVPRADPRARSAYAPPTGEVANPASPPSGCYFHPRCPFAVEACKTERPVWREITPGRHVRCHRATELDLTQLASR